MYYVIQIHMQLISIITIYIESTYLSCYQCLCVIKSLRLRLTKVHNNWRRR